MEQPPNQHEPTPPDPETVVGLAAERRILQDIARGDWPSPRDSERPHPPWPADDEPILWFLVDKARASIEAGTDLEATLLYLAAHAWFEGGIENYDRGQWDARIGPFG